MLTINDVLAYVFAVSSFFSFHQYWSLNLGLCALQAGILWLEPHLGPFALVVLKIGSLFLLKLA
jgi:hypothetical protein